MTTSILWNCYTALFAIAVAICFCIKVTPSRHQTVRDFMVIPLLLDTIAMAGTLVAICIMSAQSVLDYLQGLFA